MGADFSPEQKRWLEGFASGAAAIRGIGSGASGPAEPTGPDALGFKAQDRQVAAGGKLADPERWKRADPPFEAYARLRREALAGNKPKPDDNFRWRFHGLFWVAPAQDGFMCRMRIPNGILTHWQFAAIADLTDRYAGGYTHVTTRANLQAREIPPEGAPLYVEGLADLGIIPKGTGADNIRNVTGSSAAGIDSQELLDTRPYCRAWNHHILNTREMFGLPRKFNVSFDGGGAIPTLEDTNDIGFQAVEVDEGAPVEAGVWFRLALGGITGHKDFARDTGIVVRPDEAIRVADAIVRVFAENGTRTDRNRSRLKYVLDAWGFDKFIAAVEEVLGTPLVRLDAAHVKVRPAYDRFAHIGVHPQKQPGLNWVGVTVPVGKLTTDQMRAVAAIAREAGDGDIRLTVWQNLILSGVPDARLDDVKAALAACGLDWRANSVRAGLVACTGNRGCKFAASDTKGTALAVAEHMDGRLDLDAPVNIHITGCHNSCAQHYIGDIGLIGAKVAVGQEGDTVEGYDVHVGGGFGTEASIGRLIWKDITKEEAPERIEQLLKAYLARRSSPEESFHAFTNRHEIEALQALVAEAAP